MKKGKILIACIFAASMFIVKSGSAQWSRVGTKTYLTNAGDSLGIGTANPAYKVDIQSSGIVTMSLKSTTSNANILFDRKTAANNSTLTYRTNGVNNWQTGTIGNNNYILKNNSLNSIAIFSEYTTNNIGIGTSTPTSKLDVNGTTRVQSLALSGGGTRPVFADANGVLVAQTQSQLGSFNNSIAAGFTGLAWPCDTLKSILAVSGMPVSVNSGGIKVTLNINHSHMPNFRAYLRAPNGQRIGLVNGANVVDHFNTVTLLTNTVISDEGGPISSGSEPYTGTYAPAGSVSVTCLSSATLVNTFSQIGGGSINPNGNWTLEMETNWSGAVNVGGVTSWSIAFIAGVHAGGTNNYFPKWNNGTLTETSSIYDDGTQVGIGTASPTAKLTVFNGTTTGTYTTTGWVHSSDGRLKTNIKPIENSLQKITSLQGVNYNWKNNSGSNNQVGFIAQDVEKVFPEVVVKDENGNYAMAYQNLVAPMVEAIKEQQKQIEAKDQKIKDIQAQLDDMKSCVETLCNSSLVSNTEARTAQAADEDALFQNQPNPANTTTVIRYSLAKGNSNAEIIIRNLNGGIIKSFVLVQSGKGQVIVNAGELTAGTYTYTLVVNTNTIDTKLMVITK